VKIKRSRLIETGKTQSKKLDSLEKLASLRHEKHKNNKNKKERLSHDETKS